jgi:hypothetical protein
MIILTKEVRVIAAGGFLWANWVGDSVVLEKNHRGGGEGL